MWITPIYPQDEILQLLTNSTPLPLEIWYIIFNIKYDLEDTIAFDNLENNKVKFMKLRSNRRYVCNPSTLTEKFYHDCYSLINGFNFSFKKKTNYIDLFRYADFIGNWYLLIAKDSSNYDSLSRLQMKLDEKIREYYHNVIYTCPDKWACKYDMNQCKMIIKDIYYYIFCYSMCVSCSNEKNKCSRCIDFEQYWYFHDTYWNNYTTLRSGRLIKKEPYKEQRIILHDIYCLN